MKQTEMPEIKITLQEADIICQIIDVASTKGMFRARGGEMSKVGFIHDKLFVELQKHKPVASKNPDVINEK
tara:strand:- start:1001 stop:1213 length:213 start_codon:yes stop_codon:yes gene_type:complete